MATQLLSNKDKTMFIDSTIIGSFEIKEHSTMYRIMGGISHEYGVFDLFFGDFDTLPEAKDFMMALVRQIEAAGDP